MENIRLNIRMTNDGQRTYYNVPRSQAISFLDSPLRFEFFISDAHTLGRSEPLAWNGSGSRMFSAREKYQLTISSDTVSRSLLNIAECCLKFSLASRFHFANLAFRSDKWLDT